MSLCEQRGFDLLYCPPGERTGQAHHGQLAAKEKSMLDSQKLTSGEDGPAWAAAQGHQVAYPPPQGQPRLQEHSLLSVAVINIDQMILIKT